MHAAVQSIWAVGKATKRRHINLGEVKAALEAEKEMGSRHSDIFLCALAGLTGCFGFLSQRAILQPGHQQASPAVNSIPS